MTIKHMDFVRSSPILVCDWSRTILAYSSHVSLPSRRPYHPSDPQVLHFKMEVLAVWQRIEGVASWIYLAVVIHGSEGPRTSGMAPMLLRRLALSALLQQTPVSISTFPPNK
jgi:hypothetical protein